MRRMIHEVVVVVSQGVELGEDVVIGSCLRWIGVSLLPCNTSIIKQTLLDISHNPSRSPPGIGKGEAIPIDPNGVRCDASKEKPSFGKERKKDNSMLPPA